jgi:hypothetical protein
VEENVAVNFKDKRVTVVGMARSGIAAACVLDALGARVTITDKKPLADLGVQVKALNSDRIVVEAGGHPERIFLETDLIVLSPGVPKIAPILKARELGVTVISELELAWLLSESPYIPSPAPTASPRSRPWWGHAASREKGPRGREHRQCADRGGGAAQGPGLDRGRAVELPA